MIWLGPIANLPTTYACGSTFTIRNSISYKKGEFINIFHDNVTAKPLSEICQDVQVKPSLLPLTEERMEHRTAIETNKARLDIRARQFWIWGQQAFLDGRDLIQTHAKTLIHPYDNEPTKKRKSVTIPNELCKSNKEPLSLWYSQFTVVWVENVKLSTQNWVNS